MRQTKGIEHDSLNNNMLKSNYMDQLSLLIPSFGISELYPLILEGKISDGLQMLYLSLSYQCTYLFPFWIPSEL